MNSFGTIFKLQIFGESHGKVVGMQLDGVPPGISLKESDFIDDLRRRKPGKKGTTTRIEDDLPILQTGTLNGFTTGAPLLIQFENRNQRPKDYDHVKKQPRPGHADFTADYKYNGYNDHRGGGHFSGRLTLGIVAAGVLAKKIIDPCLVTAGLVEAGGMADVEKAIELAMNEGDSIGGLIHCQAEPIPIGLGEPFFNSIESVISHGLFAIPAVKSVGFGSAHRAASMRGSEHNDNIIDQSGRTETNHAGGINGGISNGNPLSVQVTIKPTSSISKEQNTLHRDSGQAEPMKIAGRHDVCIALRAPVVVEAVVACCLADFMLIRKTQT